MELLLLRHADAATTAASDDLRPLSEKGRGQARRMGRFCREHEICPEIILTSPLRRTKETAHLAAAELKCEVVEEPFLASGMTPASALDGLRSYNTFKTVMIVGHEPDFSLLAACLVGLKEADNLRVRKATLIGMDVESLRPGGACLEFMVPARVV